MNLLKIQVHMERKASSGGRNGIESSILGRYWKSGKEFWPLSHRYRGPSFLFLYKLFCSVEMLLAKSQRSPKRKGKKKYCRKATWGAGENKRLKNTGKHDWGSRAWRAHEEGRDQTVWPFQGSVSLALDTVGWKAVQGTKEVSGGECWRKRAEQKEETRRR